jgi:putative sigma-54 modulation protein
MRIVVNGRHFDVTDEIRDEAITKLSRVRRLFDHFLDMEVIITQEPCRRAEDRVCCEVVLYAKRTKLTASACGHDVHTAIDRAEAKITGQVRKLKTRRVQRPRLVAAAANGSGHRG